MASESRLIAGRYRIIRQLGQGAFAETDLATDTTLNRQVAIKILRPQYAEDPTFVSRFQREARAAAAVVHPNVVDVFDYGQDDSTLYLVMEYVEGPNLKQYIRENAPLDTEQATQITQQILRGLDAIHNAGIIHRDIKPQNVLMTPDGSAKLSDFGIARGALDTGLTETGTALGTAAYMAPEQARGGDIGPEADLYAAGVILFEMLTGRLPFPGDNPLQVMYQHVNEVPPRPSEVVDGIPHAMDLVVLHALAKTPEDRFHSANEMNAALVQPTPDAEAETRIMAAVTPDRTRPVSRAVVPPSRRNIRNGGSRRPEQSSRVWPLVLIASILILLGLSGVGFLATRDGDDDTDPPPTEEPTEVATEEPTEEPTSEPTEEPTPEPTEEPTPEPTEEPTPEPTEEPTPEPTPEPTEEPTPEPTPEPTEEPTPEPTEQPQVEGIGRDTPLLVYSGLARTMNNEEFEGDDFEGAFDPDEQGSFRGNVPDDAVFFFSRASGFGTGDAEFDADGHNGLFAGIRIRGMDDNSQQKAPIRVYLNDTLVFSGPSPFPNGQWGEVAWVLDDASVLREDDNVLRIQNVGETGNIGEEPWVIIHEIQVSFR